MTKKIITALVIFYLISASQANALDCSIAQKKLSVMNFMDQSALIGDRQYDKALAATYEALDYLQCIDKYSEDNAKGIEWAAGNLGSIYSYQKLDEKKSYSLYNEKIGKKIKDVKTEFKIYYGFMMFYANGNNASYDAALSRKDNKCTVTADWGTIYYGCEKIYKVTNSSLAAVFKMNELTLNRALINIAYMDNSADNNPGCPEKVPPFESYYGTVPMMLAENRIMKMAEKAPYMSSMLLQKALKLEDISFDELIATCKKSKKE